MVFEYKEEKRQRFLLQMNKANALLDTNSLNDYIKGIRYAYGLSLRYNSVNLKKIVDSNINDYNKPSFDKCIKSGILKPWNDTYWFDKDKAERLQQYIEEQPFVNPFKETVKGGA